MTQAAAQHHDDHHDDGAPHVHAVPMWLLTGIFVALLFLTIATVGVTKFDFGYETNLVVAMAIAVVKAVLVGLYFMHLRWDKPFHAMVLLGSIGFVALFIIFTLFDAGRTQDDIRDASFGSAPPSLSVEAEGH